MSDDRLRDLERRWRAGGAPEDDARLLRERVRAGALAAADLELAARLGHPAACAALARGPDDLPALAAALAATDDGRARTALALAGLALPAWTWPRPPDEVVPGEWVRDAVATLRAARARPGPGAAEAGLEAAGLARDAAAEARGDGLWRPLAARVVGFAAEGLAEPRALLEAAWLASALYSEARCREALARALLPAPLRPVREESSPPEWTSEVDWLRARLAAGALVGDRVALACALDHGPAREALDAPGPEATEATWQAAVAASGPLAREVATRSLVALAVDRLERGADTAVGRAILAAEAWLLEPAPERASEAARAAAEAERAPGSFRPTPEFHLASALRSEAAQEPSGAALGALAARAAAGDDPPGALRRGLELLADAVPLEVIAAEVVPWALGYHDPVRDRVLLGRDFVGRLTSYD